MRRDAATPPPDAKPPPEAAPAPDATPPPEATPAPDATPGRATPPGRPTTPERPAPPGRAAPARRGDGATAGHGTASRDAATPPPAAKPSPAASAERPAPRPHVVAVAVTDAAPTFELAVPCEVFGLDRADIVDPWYELRLCAGEPGPLRTAAGLGVPTPYGLDDLVEADTVIVAACARPAQLAPPPGLLAAVRKAHESGRRIVSICSGVYILAAAGLLSGRRATTHWMSAADFAHRFPDIDLDPTALYVEDGSILTSAGTGSAIDLCLHLVRQDHGAAVANEVARRMVVPPHREGGQTQYARLPARPRAGGGGGLAPVLQWARERLHEPLTVAGLAAAAHMSERTFARRFRDELGTTPLQWVLQERVRLAQELLETTDDPVESVARRTGFGTAPNLRHHFRRLTSVSPQTYRQVFRSRAVPRSVPPGVLPTAPWE